ncbi:hypothetical protein [Qipengyuania soli]|uniref:Uncharacterized protein n=1 Tax=Qipengyuania soli TaxID=2782568 RepID=A0A7S8F274_9SPHN|nr:hypothetical protein [Qipengyuania soli]QPC97766.1 hypothetical protein IRL76_07560 [Qipengyuania soli]
MTEAETPDGTAYEKRPEFLIAMYNQLMSDINRHIVVVWQMAGVVAAAVAAIAISEENGFPLALAILLFYGVCLWAIDHIHDSNFWYNRNLVMITNIERIFLTKDDLKLIHPYFASHRKKGSFLEHLSIQRNYIKLSAILAFFYFAFLKIIPTLSFSACLDLIKVLPVIGLAVIIWRDQERKKFYDEKYQEYLNISPGLTIDHSIDFGSTHGKKS